MDIAYWEIWNEPDLDADDSPNKRCWGGTAAQFYEFYKTAAIYLKDKFPHLMIGGPALANNTGAWLDDFLSYMTKDGKKVPLDFFSWHWYGADPKKLTARAKLVREKLNKAGYSDSESHLNEWNYVKSWGEGWIDSIKTMISMKGSAFNVACMCEGQRAGVDMMMYYDASPCAMNGLWDFYTWYPIKGYWSIYAFADLYDLGTEVFSESDDKDIYLSAAKDEKGNKAVLISYFTDEDNQAEKSISIELDGYENAESDIYLVDENHDYTVVESKKGSTLTLTLSPNTFVMIKSK